MTYIQAPRYPLTIEPIVGDVFIAGPRFNALYIIPSFMFTDLTAGAGTFNLSMFTGSSVESVASTQDWYTYGVQRFAAKPHLLRVRPTTAIDFLAGIPVPSAIIDYPLARVKVSASGTPVTGRLNFLSHGLLRGVLTVGSTATWGKNADPYEHYGNLQTTPPVVRGLYRDNVSSVPISTFVAGTQYYWMWVDGLLDSIDPAKIYLNGTSHVSQATFIQGFGGQLVRLTIAVAPSVDALSASMTFDAGAMVRAGQPSEAQTFPLATDNDKRFVRIMHTSDDAASSDQFSSGISVPVTFDVGVTRHVVPVAEDAVRWQVPGEDEVHVSIDGTAYGPSITSRVVPATPTVENTVIGQEARAHSANYRTADRVGVITPLVCDGVRGSPAEFVTFTAPYLPVGSAVNLKGDVYNITKDQWLPTLAEALVWDDTSPFPQPTVPPTLVEYSQVFPAGWEEGDICVCIGDANRVWPVNTPPCIRFPTGAYPLSKATGPTQYLSYNIVIDISTSEVFNPPLPTLTKHPASYATVGYYANYDFDPSTPIEADDLVTMFQGLNPIRVKLAPFSGSLELNTDSTPNPADFTVELASINTTVAYTKTAAPLGATIWNGGYYDPYAAVVWPAEVPGAKEYYADPVEGASGMPGDDPNWILVGDYTGPFIIHITMSGSVTPGPHPVHDIGYVAVLTDAAGDVFPDDAGTWITSAAGNAYGVPDYPLHLNVLRSDSEQQPARIWADEVALPLLAP